MRCDGNKFTRIISIILFIFCLCRWTTFCSVPSGFSSSNARSIHHKFDREMMEINRRFFLLFVSIIRLCFSRYFERRLVSTGGFFLDLYIEGVFYFQISLVVINSVLVINEHNSWICG